MTGGKVGGGWGGLGVERSGSITGWGMIGLSTVSGGIGGVVLSSISAGFFLGSDFNPDDG